MSWKKLRANVTGSIDEELRLGNEYLVIENRILRIAQEIENWGYDRISGALKNLGYPVSDTTVANVLKRSGLPPAGDRKTETTWAEFVTSHMDVLVATDFFTAEVWSRVGLITYYVLFFIHLSTRKVNIAGIELFR